MCIPVCVLQLNGHSHEMSYFIEIFSVSEQNYYFVKDSLDFFSSQLPTYFKIAFMNTLTDCSNFTNSLVCNRKRVYESRQ
jgi:hypothetical protein